MRFVAQFQKHFILQKESVKNKSLAKKAQHANFEHWYIRNAYNIEKQKISTKF